MIHLSGDGSRVCGEMSCVSLVGAGKEKLAFYSFFSLRLVWQTDDVRARSRHIQSVGWAYTPLLEGGRMYR